MSRTIIVLKLNRSLVLSIVLYILLAVILVGNKKSFRHSSDLFRKLVFGLISLQNHTKPPLECHFLLKNA